MMFALGPLIRRTGSNATQIYVGNDARFVLRSKYCTTRQYRAQTPREAPPDSTNSNIVNGFFESPMLLPGSRASKLVHVSLEVSQALKQNIPVVALETTIYTHGFPYPDNVALALGLEDIVRGAGAIPATIGILNGTARIGMTSDEITSLASSAGKPETMKVSRRDIPYILGMVSSSRDSVNATFSHRV